MDKLGLPCEGQGGLSSASVLPATWLPMMLLGLTFRNSYRTPGGELNSLFRDVREPERDLYPGQTGGDSVLTSGRGHAAQAWRVRRGVCRQFLTSKGRSPLRSDAKKPLERLSFHGQGWSGLLNKRVFSFVVRVSPGKT